MMRAVAVLLVVLMAFMVVAPTAAEAGSGRGGFMGFIAGCCFGLRAAIDYNEGMDIHWREWGRIIPYVGLVFGIWDGIEGAQGITRSELAERYGSQYY